ncbi:hypothetical protein Scep_021514 [Stephania cephalantha]|uniref:GPI ethanolamine phosphate transferase 1 n=1 Tax=Stephania cephalantha TaxID=152367 RepID=A0AAP0I1J3_9MAGN
MGVEDGILGRRDSDSTRVDSIRKNWLKKRERWLVVLGIVLHAVYMLSIFDIYFKSPIVHGMEPVLPRFKPPAKRLVLLVADGLRADKFFEPDIDGQFRAPFLRSVIKGYGRWGVSHARPPTESRPGHVAIIAGFYEDPSAVTKGWKANPVEFDSVFNQSRHTFAFGSPDIVPIFCAALPNSTWNTYPHELEDFATDASFLDEWSLDQFQSLLNRSHDDLKLKKLLLQDNLVIFLHLLGCDSNGHAHKPFSSIYLNNVKVVDHIAESVYHLVEGYFKDNQTAYIFTADHGMSDKVWLINLYLRMLLTVVLLDNGGDFLTGSHGDGHPTNTDTPLVAWGAGVKHPRRVSRGIYFDDGFRFIDDHVHHMPTPIEWGLSGIERVDVNQADIAPLMSTLLGLPCPVNSVGNLPLGYIDLNEVEEVEAAMANTKQILNQFLRKSSILYDEIQKDRKRSRTSCFVLLTNLDLKQSSLRFKPFKQLENHTVIFDQIEHLLSVGENKAAMELLQTLRQLSMDGLYYFQTYDWSMLMMVVTLGYVGWMVNLLLHVLQSYTSFSRNINKKNYQVYLPGFACALSISVLEFLVYSFTDRKLYTFCFLITGIVAALHVSWFIPGKSMTPIFLWVSCWILSTFTLMPAEIPDNTMLVIASGAMIILVGIAARWLDSIIEGNKSWLGILGCGKQKPKSQMLFYSQVLLVGLSAGMVWLSTSHRTENQELLMLHQLINWSMAGVNHLNETKESFLSWTTIGKPSVSYTFCISMVLPFFASEYLLARLTSIFLGFAPPFYFYQLGISLPYLLYEAVFYGALGLVLMSWILYESALLYSNRSAMSSNVRDTKGKTLEHDDRCLVLSDIRVPLTFLVLFNVAFFGTGNFASIASFEISSVYRFITIFSPFLMAALLIFKLFIPFMLVMKFYPALSVPWAGADLTNSIEVIINLAVTVRNTGSWMEIAKLVEHVLAAEHDDTAKLCREVARAAAAVRQRLWELAAKMVADVRVRVLGEEGVRDVVRAAVGRRRWWGGEGGRWSDNDGSCEG